MSASPRTRTPNTWPRSYLCCREYESAEIAACVGEHSKPVGITHGDVHDAAVRLQRAIDTV